MSNQSLREAAQQALGALESVQETEGRDTYLEVDYAIDELREALAQPDDPPNFENMLGNLLARIHRDGGHYINEHGWEKAFLDADEKVVKWLVRDDDKAQPVAKFDARDDAERLKSVGRGMSYNDLAEAVWKHTIMEIAMRLETGGYAAPQPPAEQSFQPDWMTYKQGLADGRAEDEQGAELSDYPPLPMPAIQASPVGQKKWPIPMDPYFSADQMRAYVDADRAQRPNGAALSDERIVAANEQFDFRAHLVRQAAFSLATFGPGMRTLGVTDHIRKELIEISAKPDDLMEWIDVVILALDGAWRCGGSPDQIITAIVAKQTKNEGRSWPDWRTADPNKAIEHERAARGGAA